MNDNPRLIERAFPLKQASLDSVHEKNVRHGHISTLHIWPARRPLAASRAALIATLLPDPGTPEERQKLCERIGGKVVQKIEKKKMPGGRTVERIKEETEGGILHWKRETENAETLEWFRQEIRKAYGGRAPRVLDPFAGGGSIPLEAMRLGCDVTAVDINPVAWFILKCTLEYPQKLAGKTCPLPAFVLEDEDFMATFYKAHPNLVGKTKRTKKQVQEFRNDMFMSNTFDSGRAPEADLTWHVRAWGKWVLDRARRDVGKFYPTYADFEALKPGKAYEKEPMRLVSLKDDSTADIDALNAEFSEDYLADKRNPRWVAKPTVAYLWARTVTCKNCRATVPLLKTRWLCKKANKRVLLTMEPEADKSGVVFGIDNDVPVKGGNAAQRREHDKRIGEGTMSRAGAKCPCCGTIMTREDIQTAGRQGNIGGVLTAVVCEGPAGKEYRFPGKEEIDAVALAEEYTEQVFKKLPYGRPEEPVVLDAKGNTWCALYGVDQFSKLYNPRQLVSMGGLAVAVRRLSEQFHQHRYPKEWSEGLLGLLALAVGRLADFNSTCVTWTPGGEFLGHTFVRWALPFVWDYCEGNPFGGTSGNYMGAVEWIARATSHTLGAVESCASVSVLRRSATKRGSNAGIDIIVTDPPYYDAVGYAVLMDYFYIWHRRMLAGLIPTDGYNTDEELSPKWNHQDNDGELIDDASVVRRNCIDL